MKISTEIFSEWALNGKDEGMEENHRAAVSEMLSIISNNRSKPFSFIDAGCGNGWVVRLMKKHSLCHLAIGIDGAVEMIKKAKTIDPDGIYFCSDLLKWIPEQKVDLIHSMEVFYYLKHPSELIRHMALNCLKPGGEMIMGVDFYLENKNEIKYPESILTKSEKKLYKYSYNKALKKRKIKNTLIGASPFIIAVGAAVIWLANEFNLSGGSNNNWDPPF